MLPDGLSENLKNQEIKRKSKDCMEKQPSVQFPRINKFLALALKIYANQL